jgi:ECF sigma factor
MQPPPTCVTVLLARAENDHEARLFLYDAVKTTLERMAHAQLAGDRRTGMLDTQLLFNDAFRRLYQNPVPGDDEQARRWRDRQHFYAIAAHVMRLIRIDYARRRKPTEELHSGIRDETSDHVERADQADLLLALDRELTALEEVDPEAAKVFEVRYFGAPGDERRDPADSLLSEREAAAQLGLSRYAVRAAHHRACVYLIARLPRLGVSYDEDCP